MSCLLLLLVAAAPAEQVEQTAARFVAGQFERVGRTAPASDPALTRAARALAQQALSSTAAEAAELTNLTAALSEAGGFDPTPHALVLRGSPLDEPLRTLQKRTDFADEPSSHAGVGFAQDERRDVAALVVLLAQRRAEVDPFPHVISKRGGTQTLCATLAPHLASAEVYVTRPQGEVDKVPTTARGEKRCATLTFAADGRHTVEILARGEQGPEVAALFFVRVGKPEANVPVLKELEPQSTAEARARVLGRINGLRRGYALGELRAEPELDAVAQAYAERMATENFFAHVAPDGSDVRGRLKARGYPYQSAGENLGLASGPLAAHFGLEHSPGHRKNLLEPGYLVAGVGVAKNQQGLTVLVEVLATPPVLQGSPVDQAYGAIDQARRGKHLPPLTHVGELEQLAADHARRALASDTPSARLADGTRLHDRVFAARDDVGSATVDVFVAESPALITDSANLVDPRTSLVGVGVARGDSPTYGKAKFWVVVVYASQR